MDESSGLRLRTAEQRDLVDIVRMLADDPLGARREDFRDPLPASYQQALEAITADPNQLLLIAEHDDRLVGVLQLGCTPYLTYRGSWRASIEGVRVDRQHRGLGIGRRLFEHAIATARDRGCHLVQLTTDKERPDALAFYQSLGFAATHEGLKLHL